MSRLSEFFGRRPAPSRSHVEKRVEDLNGSLQRERMERAVVEGALEAVRKDNSRLQSEVASLRSTVRRGGEGTPAMEPAKQRRLKGDTIEPIIKS